MTSLHISSERNGTEDILSVLASASCNVNARNKLGRTALHLAAKLGNLENLKTLLDAGCDRNIKDKLGFTAVGLAFKFNHKTCAEVLLHYKPLVKSEGVEIKLIEVTPSTKSPKNCDKSLLKLTDSVANRKALSLKIYHLILTILTQKRNVMYGSASPKSRKTLESVETAFERKLLNLILPSTSLIRYQFAPYTFQTLDDKLGKQCLCDLKPSAIERSNSLLKNCESSVLTKLLQGLKDTLQFASKSSGGDQSLALPWSWKLEENEIVLEDFKTFVQMIVKVCNDRSPKDSTFNTSCDITALQDDYEKKCTDTEAFEGGFIKLNEILTALGDKEKPKDDFYEIGKSCIADNVENCLSSLDHWLSIKSTAAVLFVEDVLETFFQNPNVFIFCLNQKGSLFNTLLDKVLLPDDGPWLPDKIARIFLCACVVLVSDQRLLLSCAGAVLKTGLSHQHSDPFALGTCLLVRMGLLKQEEEVDIVNDLKGPLLALEHLCTEEYFPRDLAAIFASFLCKASPKLFGLDQLRLRALASAVTKEIVPTSAQEAGCDVGKCFKRICDMVAVEGDCELLIKCVDPLFSRVFVTLKCDVWGIGESILTYLGLLKSEFYIETVRNLCYALKVLHHAVKQSYFPSLLKELLACFLKKPNPALTPYSKEVDNILSAIITTS